MRDGGLGRLTLSFMPDNDQNATFFFYALDVETLRVAIEHG